MSQHISAPVPPLHEINSAVPPPIEGIIRKCLRKNPDERYEDATSLEADLRNWRDLPLTQFIFGDEQTMAPPRNSDLRLILLIFGISAVFLAVSIFLLVVAYLIGHAH
jgi:serine/threonine protein kinase